MRILIIDDEVQLLRMLALSLRLEGLQVDTADNGVSGLTILRESQPDLLVLDQQMPDMNGDEVYHAAREAGYTGPVIICSAYNARAGAVRLGAEGSIDKPLDPDRLLALVKELVPNQQE